MAIFKKELLLTSIKSVEWYYVTLLELNLVFSNQCRQMFINVAQNDFTRKMTPLQKNAKECERFGQINCAKGVAQSPINRPIWSHCLQPKCHSSSRCDKMKDIL